VVIIPAKARIMESPAYVCLSVCLSVRLSVTTITKENVDGSGLNFLGRFLGGKASASSFAVTIASQKTLVYSSSFFLSYSRLLTGKSSSEYLYTDTYARRK